MKIDAQNVFAELERLAAACPWDSVDIWITRYPEGKVHFTAYVRENDKLGMPSVFGTGGTLAETVDDALKDTANRDPEIMRKKKITELQEKIERLQAVNVGLPPYQPNRELAAGSLTVPDPIVEV